MNVIIKKSNNTNKKIMAIIENTNNNNKKTLHFGDSRYSDYTQHKDTERKKAYLSRHKTDNFNNPNFASFYATNLLWNKPTLKESIKNTNEKYNINIKLKS